jgi:tetratricopeptide (TPR) repeat protein
MMLAVLAATLLVQTTPEAPTRSAPDQVSVASRQGAPAGTTGRHLAAGLTAFRARRLKAAQSELELAVADDPTSAAAAFYLGYTLYKLGEPARRMNANKERARELFAKAFSLDPTFTPTFK